MNTNKMNIAGLIIISITMMANTCKGQTEKSLPSCIADMITEIKKSPVANPPSEVWSWKTEETTYYLFTSECCDRYNYLYTDSCEILCSPEGGITGRGDGKCSEEILNAVKALIWKDTRK